MMITTTMNLKKELQDVLNTEICAQIPLKYQALQPFLCGTEKQ